MKRDQFRYSHQPSLEFRSMRNFRITQDGELATRRLSDPMGMFSYSKSFSETEDVRCDKKGEGKMDTNLLLQCPDCHVPLVLEICDVRTFQVSSSGIEIHCSFTLIENPKLGWGWIGFSFRFLSGHILQSTLTAFSTGASAPHTAAG